MDDALIVYHMKGLDANEDSGLCSADCCGAVVARNGWAVSGSREAGWRGEPGRRDDRCSNGSLHQFINQLVGAGAALALTLVGSFILLKVIDAVVGLRVSQDEEIQGLDLSQHGEEGYIFY